MIELVLFTILGTVVLVLPIIISKSIINILTGIFIIVLIYMFGNMYATTQNITLEEIKNELSRNYQQN